MTWFCKTVVCCTTLLLLGYTLEVLGYTLWICQRECKEQPDDPVCSRWNFTTEDQARTKLSAYKWLRNECERKCFSMGDYERVMNMDLCYQNGENRTAYLCGKHTPHSKSYKRCMRNESLDDD